MASPPTRYSGQVAGVLLAGGLSRRMGGGDKCLLELAGRPMLAHVIERLAPQCAVIAINANGDPARFADFGLPIIADTVEGFVGPLAGVLAGMRWAARYHPSMRWIATVSADAPFLPNDLIKRLVAAVENPNHSPHDAPAPATIVLAKSAGHLHPVIGLWPVALADDLHAALHDGVRKVLHWTDHHRMVTVEFPLAIHAGQRIDPFLNINTPEELAAASALASATLQGPTEQ